MKFSLKVATTSKTINVFIRDSSSTTGGGLTGLVFNTASLTCYYALPRAAAVSVTLATLAAVTSAYSSGGFKEIDSTNMAGWYRFDIPDAALASGTFVDLHFKGATNMAPTPVEIELTAVDSQDAVRGGMTALPNANAEAAGGLYTRGTGAGQINQPANGMVDINVVRLLGTAWLTPGTAGTPDVNVKLINAVATTSITTINANLGTTQPHNFTGTGASALVKGDAIDWNSVAVTGMPMPTYTQPTGFLAATFPSGTIANTTNITAGTITTVTNLTNAATSGDFTAAMKASITAAVPTAAQNATANWANATRTLTTLSGLTVDANMIKILDDPSAAGGLQAMGNMFDTSGAVPATDSSGNALATATALTAAANAILTEGGPGPWTGGGGGGSLTTTQNALIQSGTEK